MTYLLQKSRLNKEITSALNTEDLTVLLFTFIYLAEFSSIPSVLFDPSQTLPSKIVKKTSLFMLWKDGTKKTKLNGSTLDSLIKQAMARLKGRDVKVDNYINCAYIDKELVLGRVNKAKDFVELKLRLSPQNVTLWKYMKKICQLSNVNFQSIVDIKPNTSELTFFMANSVENNELSLKLIENYPKKILLQSSIADKDVANFCYL